MTVGYFAYDVIINDSCKPTVCLSAWTQPPTASGSGNIIVNIPGVGYGDKV